MTNMTNEAATSKTRAELLTERFRNDLQTLCDGLVEEYYDFRNDQWKVEGFLKYSRQLFMLKWCLNCLQSEIEKWQSASHQGATDIATEPQKAATRTEINDILMDVLIDRLRATNSFRRGKDEAMADIYYGEVRGLIFAMRYMTAPMISNTQYTELDELATEAYAGDLDSTRRSDIQKKVEAILG